MIETSTRLLRPAELTRAAIKSLDVQAARLVAEALAVGPIPDPVPTGNLYQGRHRTTQDVETRLITPDKVEAARRLPTRAHGAALAAEQHTRKLTGPRRILASLLHALPRGAR